MANFTTDGKLCIERELQVTQVGKHCDNLTSQFDLIKTCNWIRENNYSKICLQFPDDLLPVSAKIYEEIKNGVDVDLYILGDTSYASCCVDSVAAMHVQGDAIIHYGHSCLTKSNIPVFTVLPKKDLDVESVMTTLKENFNSDDNVKLCLYYGAEFDHYRDEISQSWFEQYQHSYIAHVEKEDIQDRYLGRIIRNSSGETVPVELLKDCICIHIGLKGQTMFNYTISIPAAEWYLLNPETNKIERMEETAWFKRRRFLIEKCKDANVVGILVCKLAGNQTKDIISRMKQLCRVNGKKSYIVSVGKPNVAKLANFPEIDIYVMIACTENELYSSRDFYKPIVYPFELEVALNTNRQEYYSHHVTDYDELLSGKRYYCDLGNVEEGTDVSLVTGKIRQTTLSHNTSSTTDIEVKQNWQLDTIGQNLHERSWRGLEQKLGETEVKKAEQGREGIPLKYNNEPNK